ncbi:hypothetical protein [Streptomyces sp. NPDC047028]|uniref:hypothetical protein n=1 Tax=Streptomyces sp. NPDC047028 TaxID=3155793 RepID=UPI0033F771ED
MNVPVRAAADLRLLRAAVFSAVCVALSASGHALASGTGMPLWSLVAGWAGVLGVVGPLAGRERSLPGIALSLLAGETGLHLLFCIGQSPVRPAPDDRSATVVAVAERLLCDPQAAHLTPRAAALIVRQSGLDPTGVLSGPHGSPGMSGTGMAGMTGHGGLVMMLGSMLTPPMIAAHVAAALVTGWLLRRCEIALWKAVQLPVVTAEHLARRARLRLLSGLLIARVQKRVAGQLRRLSAARAVHRRRGDGCAWQRQSAILWTRLARRGPPVVAVAA